MSDGGWHRTEKVGREYLSEVTRLLQRVRAEHPTAGLFEVGDLQWSWRLPRASDEVAQRFWLDDDGRPEAAVIVIEEADATALVPILRPDADPGRVAHVVEDGLARIGSDRAIEVEVGRDDTVLGAVLARHGFTVVGDGVVETWLASDARPVVSPLADGYRLTSRADTADGPHPMTHAGRNHPDVEPRLRQTSLYRPDLDLAVLDAHGDVAAYGLFWFDPTTATGLVEPMRTEDAHQRRGLARHVLTAGVDRLAAAGAQRIKICFEPDNPASSHLYPSAGFQPDRSTVIYRRG